MRCALVPFQSVVHELLPRRSHDASRNAVYQAMIAWGAESDGVLRQMSKRCMDESLSSCARFSHQRVIPRSVASGRRQ